MDICGTRGRRVKSTLPTGLLWVSLTYSKPLIKIYWYTHRHHRRRIKSMTSKESAQLFHIAIVTIACWKIVYVQRWEFVALVILNELWKNLKHAICWFPVERVVGVWGTSVQNMCPLCCWCTCLWTHWGRDHFGIHFADGILKFILVYKKCFILIQISLKFVCGGGGPLVTNRSPHKGQFSC